MTNRDWLNQLDYIEFAYWLKNEFSLTEADYLDLIDWLKQEYPEWYRKEN